MVHSERVRLISVRVFCAVAGMIVVVVVAAAVMWAFFFVIDFLLKERISFSANMSIMELVGLVDFLMTPTTVRRAG